MRYKFTVLLLFLNFAVLGLILYLDARGEREARTEGYLSNIIGREIVEADRIEVRGRALEQPRVLVREGSAWSIVEPIQWSANYFAVNRILNQLQFLQEQASFSVEEVKRTGQSLADYGLEDPLFEIAVGRGGESIKLAVGAPTEIGENVYLLGPNRETVFVIGKDVVNGLLVDLADLRTREVFDIPVFEIEELALQISTGGTEAGGGTLRVRLARTNDGWMFEAPLNAPADSALVSTAINQLTTARTLRFIEPEAIDPVLLGFESPFMRVTLHGNRRRQTLVVGNPDTSASEPAYYARLEGNPTAFTLAARPLEDLREAQDALRERDILDVDPEALSAVEISSDGLQVRLQRLETGDWQAVQSGTGEDIRPRRADPGAIRSLIEGLVDLRATGFAVDTPTPADLERLGFNQPRRTVRLALTGGDAQVLRLAHPEDENTRLYARTDTAETVYEVDRREALRLLPLKAINFRDRTLESLPEAAVIESIRLERLPEEDILFEQRAGAEPGAWQVALADVPEGKREAVLALVEAVRRFRVRSFIRENYEEVCRLDSKREEPWAFRLEAKILLPGGETPQQDTREYVFTKRLSGALQAGGSARHDAVFYLDEALVAALETLVGDLQLPPEARDEPVPGPVAPEPVPPPGMPDLEP